MIDHDYFELFQQDSIDKQLVIECEDGTTITNEDIFSESMTITESLCSEDSLKFGSCEASSFKIQVANIMSSLIGQWLTVSIKLNGSDVKFPIGKYKVNSDKPTADRAWRNIVAYDAMYDILNTDVSDWYNELLPNTDKTVSLKTFRDSFCSYFGITQESTTLVNDSMTIERTITPSELSGKDVITAICEINGVFGHITRNGTLEYIELKQGIEGLYPANDLYPANNLYPRESGTTRLAKDGEYISADYEDFKCQSITKLQIRQEENDVGSIVGTGDNCYIIEDNFLVYGKSASDLEKISSNTFSKITDCVYRPFTAEVKGNFCFEVGDPVRLYTKYELIESYILNRTISGIQGLRDSFETKGEEVCSESVNSVNKSIVQLKGKTNVLERTVEETRSELSDLSEDVMSEISQTAHSISLSVNNSTGTSSSITISLLDENGNTIAIESDTITLNGLVKFTDLSTSGSTTISGDNITTGTISCDLLDGGTITGQEISGGTITGTTITGATVNATGVFSTTSGNYKSILDSGALKLYLSDTLYAKFSTTEWDSKKGYYGTAVNSEPNSKFISFGNKESSSDTKYTVPFLINFGLDPNNDEEDVLIYGTAKFTETVYFGRGGAALKATSGGNLYSVGIMGVNGEPTTGYALTVTGKAYATGNIKTDGALNATRVYAGGDGNSSYTLYVNGTSYFDSNATFDSDVTMEVDLTVKGNVEIGDLTISNHNLYSSSTVSLQNSGGQVIFYNGNTLSFRPQGDYKDTIYLGAASYYWAGVYSKDGSISKSDRNAKHDIEDISKKYEELFFKLKPVSYVFNDGKRTHIGAISQDVEESMNEVGLSDLEFAGFCKDVKMQDVEDEDGNITEEKVLDADGNEQYDYSLRYSEFIMLNTHMIQKAYKKIEEQQAEIDTLKEQVSFLMKKLGGNAE